MSNDSEKGNKIWNVVAQFLLLLAILVSFLMPVLILILIVEAWTPELLEYLRTFIKDKQIYKQIITIITLLVSVSLSYFLLLYMNRNPEKADKKWRQVVTWPLLLFTLLMSVLMSVFILFQMVGTWYPEQLKFLTVFKDNQIIAIITLLASVSLFSFLLQIYMSIDSEVGDKNWRQAVFWSVLLPTLLMSVLILSIEIWVPELLEPLRKFIIDNQVFTIITLLASMSLLSFLLQIYMNKNPEKADKIWKIVACPVHWAIRIVARTVLLLAILLTVIVTPIFYPIYFAYRLDFIRLSAWLLLLLTILLTVLILSLIPINILESELLKSLWVSIKDNLNRDTLNIIMIITLLTSIGLFSLLLSKSIEDIRASLSNIHKKIVKVFRYGGLPGMDIGQSLSVTWWCYLKKVWPFMKETFIQSQKLFFALLLLWIILLCGYFPIEDNIKWQKKVMSNLKAIKGSGNVIVLSSSDLEPTYLSEKGAQFALFYRFQGDLDSKIGICPADSSDLVEWLTLFKQAISKCSADKQVKLKVRAFASTAPVTQKGHLDTTKSDTFNYQIANERAKAFIYFLTLNDPKYTLEKCKDALNDSLIWKSVEPDSNWEGTGFTMTPDDSAGVQWKGPHFIVNYKPWESHIQMTKAKLVKDGTLDNRRHALEFLNRTVQIIIEDGGCLTKEEDNTEVNQ